MAKVKNISGEDRYVPWVGDRLVLAGQVIEVPDGDSYAYTSQVQTWAPADKATQTLHDKAYAAAHPEPEPVPADTLED